MKKLEFEQVTTRGGDKGESGYYSGERVRKDDIIFETVGELDLLNSYIGMAKLSEHPRFSKKHWKFLDSLQTDIINLSGLIATNPKSTDGEEVYKSIKSITQKDVTRLEKFQHKLMTETEIEPIFVHPGTNSIAVHLDICRSVSRKCERLIVSVIRDKVRTDLFDVQNYLNRLSDVFFIMARYFEQNQE